MCIEDINENRCKNIWLDPKKSFITGQNESRTWLQRLQRLGRQRKAESELSAALATQRQELAHMDEDDVEE